MATCTPPEGTPRHLGWGGAGGLTTKGGQLLTCHLPNILLLLLLRQPCEALESSIPLAFASFSSLSLYSPCCGVSSESFGV